MRKALELFAALLAVSGCGPQPLDRHDEVGSASSELTVGLTPDFRTWLASSRFAGDDFARDDLTGGSYGGKGQAGQAVLRQPVIFIHGNADAALGTAFGLTGFKRSIEYFRSVGYSSAELYATSWGPANPNLSGLQYHSRDRLRHTRRFIEAVLEYTGAAKVDVIAHSMGVTLARKAIKGGPGHDAAAGGGYDLGLPLTSKVDAFVGIAGANLGLASCYGSGPTTPTCGSTNGFYPGVWTGFRVAGRSAFLQELRSSSRYEGSHRFSIHSQVDEIVGGGGLVYGEYTGRIPGQTGEKRYSAVPYGHLGVKDLTAAVQWRMVDAHTSN